MSNPSNPYAEDPNAFEPPVEQPEKKPKGCVFWGCVIVGIGFALLLVMIIAGGVGGYYFLKGQIMAYTEEEPAELPVVEMDEEQVAEIEGRIEQLKQSFDEGTKPEDLVLTADEINALIAKNEDFKGKVFVRIEEGIVTGDVSIPTDFLPIGKGRYFNASASFDVRHENGVLIITLTDATIKGEPLPDEFLEALKNENFAQELYKDPKNAEFLSRIEDVDIVDDKIILRARAAEPSEAGDGDAAPAEVEVPGDEPVAP